MARKVSVTDLNARSIDIINVIRANAPAEYQSLVPKITKETDIPKVGDVLMGYPAMANIFISALLNRIALVKVKSATFNNAYKELKKGYLEYGETVEEVFVEIAKAREFSAEKAKDRELARTLPDVRSAFHIRNYSVQYPVTIQRKDLQKAFLSAEGVTDMVAKIVQSLYTGAEYDEYLLFKYLMIKAISHGQVAVAQIASGGTGLDNAAVAFRSTSNRLTMMGTEFNREGVHTSTPRSEQYIFMDSEFNARFDVVELASAFNLDRANFIGRLLLVDDWTSFDNDRFSEITANTGMMESVTTAELNAMAHVKAFLVDREWFQVYDNIIDFTENFVASGRYWNYNLNVEKTVSTSPFSNAIVFVDSTATITPPATIKVTITDKSEGPDATVLTFTPETVTGLSERDMQFLQNESLTTAGIAVHKYGAYLIPKAKAATSLSIQVDLNGTTYSSPATPAVNASSTVGTSVTLSPPSDS